MQSLLIANPPPEQFFTGLLVGLSIVIAVIVLFLGSKPALTWRRLLNLCLLTLVVGTMVGAAFGGLYLLVEEVSPLDRWAAFIGPTMIGIIAGVTVSVCLGVVGTIRIVVQKASRDQ